MLLGESGTRLELSVPPVRLNDTQRPSGGWRRGKTSPPGEWQRQRGNWNQEEKKGMWGGMSPLLKMAARPTARSAAVGRWLRRGKGRRGGKRDEARNLGRSASCFLLRQQPALTLRIPFRQHCAASSLGGASCKRASISRPSFRDCFSCLVFFTLQSLRTRAADDEDQKAEDDGSDRVRCLLLALRIKEKEGERKNETLPSSEC